MKGLVSGLGNSGRFLVMVFKRLCFGFRAFGLGGSSSWEALVTLIWHLRLSASSCAAKE